MFTKSSTIAASFRNSYLSCANIYLRQFSFKKAFGHDSRPRFENDRIRSESFGPSLNSVNFDQAQLPPIQKSFYVEHPEVTNRSAEELSALLNDHSLNIVGVAPLPKPITTFEHVQFPETIMNELNKVGFSAPSGIQKIAWPVALSGRDLVAIAETGSGKTLGFLLPGLVHIKAQSPSTTGPTMLVLAPTRELAVQTAAESNKFLRSSGIRTCAVYGGAFKNAQLKELRTNPQIVVATPGRLIDLVSSGDLDLRRVSYLVLDEADRMLDMGFEEQIRKILGQVRPDKQILLWSATWPKEVRALAAEFCRSNPVKVTLGSEDLTANPRIKHEIYTCTDRDLSEAFTQWVKENASFKDEKSIVFVNKKRDVDDLTDALKYEGFKVASIHGDKSQSERDFALKQFKDPKNKNCMTLVATDVAGRGLDVKNVDRVVNVGAPNNLEDFIHRIGRTARGGASGIATSFIDYSVENLSARGKFVNGLVDLLQKVDQTPSADLLDLQMRCGGNRFSSNNKRGGFGFGGKGSSGGKRYRN